MNMCTTCELIMRRDNQHAPLWDNILRTQFWDVVHCNNTSLLGWLILVTRRHIATLDEMTEQEALEMGKLTRLVSLALKAHTNCTKTYLAQFAEAAGHHHVHIHLIPRMPDQPETHKGPHIFKYLGVPPEVRCDETTMNHFAQQIRQTLLKDLPSIDE